MLQYEDLTVGTVAGLVAAGVWNDNSASTWSVVGRTLHSSHWPVILRTDTAGVQGVRRSVRFTTLIQLRILVLIPIAAIVTPLGLYEAVYPQDGLREVTFEYVRDDTSMSLGTLLRRNDFGPSRWCWTFHPQACPWFDTIVTEIVNETPYDAGIPDGYDMRIPRNITEIYSAGVSKFGRTVSSVFDIQWRTYRLVLEGKFVKKEAMVTNDAWEAITGLVVNTKTGGVGFRNHTAPPPLPYGGVWEEDLLFIEPETQCVDMNITLDFRIANATKNAAENVVITDRGGFTNLNTDPGGNWPPSYDTSRTWEDARLRDRAYLAAWYSNALTMMYLNVSNPKEPPYTTSFVYKNSELGTRFPVDADYEYGSGFQIHGQGLTGLINCSESFSRSNDTGLWPNPFKITERNFSQINSMLFDPGTEWTIPLYSCASASKASIKTVSFRYNGTQGLQSLDVTNIQPKEYPKEEDKPLWTVENLAVELHDVNPVWGMTTPDHANGPNITTWRGPHLYLPGFVRPDVKSPVARHQYLAGVDFYPINMALTYNMDEVDSGFLFGTPDYTGRSNLALYRKWQEIINLIWTDLSANGVVGTKGHIPSDPLQNLQKRAEDTETAPKLPITVYTRRGRFKYLYGIHAFLALALGALILIASLGFIVLGKSSPSRLRRFLDHTSPGRIFTTVFYPNEWPPGAPSKSWTRSVGYKRIDISTGVPRPVDGGSGTVAVVGAPMDGDKRYSPVNGGEQSCFSAQGETGTYGQGAMGHRVLKGGDGSGG
ncbi:hypothetical protein M011DRAFT_522494 [Sporormia fimetaria CBS 119925]|uniref:Uncharacterized protein n=1 Tax=Sporormia fimetaria CBS 119925 TaxID=1340428 RepID=A0A6A6UY24_9PLEO|nr:hypothetical protein M011DRAFT_522494 [Sporormia fimetaria CBS 119925]